MIQRVHNYVVGRNRSAIVRIVFVLADGVDGYGTRTTLIVPWLMMMCLWSVARVGVNCVFM